MDANGWANEFRDNWKSDTCRTYGPAAFLEAAEAIDAMQAKYDAALAYLRKHEWYGVDTKYVIYCDECNGYQPNHNPGCELAAILEGEK